MGYLEDDLRFIQEDCEAYANQASTDKEKTERISEYTEILSYLADLHVVRLQNAHNIHAYERPKFGKIALAETYQRVEQAESDLASPALTKQGYRLGVASRLNEIGYFRGEVPILITTEHATVHWRQDELEGRLKRKGPDRGTGGLGYVLQEDLGANLMTMLGRQTGDANHDEEHPFKQAMEHVIVSRGIKTVLAIHGMKAGKFIDFTDEKAIDVLIGVGPEPSDESLALGWKIRMVAEELGLTAVVNEYFVKIAEDNPMRPVRQPDGSIVYETYSALPHYTTRAYAQRVAEKHNLPLAAVQVELSDLLRYQPKEIKRGQLTRKVGVYLGYLLLRRSLEEWWGDNQL